MKRPTWEEYALDLAIASASRSEDPYSRTGAAILRADHTLAATGYNGAPAGVTMDWSDRDSRRLWVIHAEMNALRLVQPGEGYLLAATMMPCLECMKLTRAQGILEVVYQDRLPAHYEPALVIELAQAWGVRVRHIERRSA